MGMYYCPNDKRNVNTAKEFSVLALVILLCIFIVPGLIYYFAKPRVCPICHTPEKMLQAPKYD